jgi:pimeloyl-ACP methyl ester carboxylesterase
MHATSASSYFAHVLHLSIDTRLNPAFIQIPFAPDSRSNLHLVFLYLASMGIEFEHGNLFCYKTGSGQERKKALLLFHGVGQDHTVFNSLVHNLTDSFNCYAFDLFFHGRSQWKDHIPMTKEEWSRGLSRFLERENIDRFDVLGYSLGGRLALATTEAFPDKADNLYMVAGEGVRKNFWYSWATHPLFGQPLFKGITRNPSVLFTLLKIGERLKIIPTSMRILALSQMRSPEKRNQVYGSWILLSKLNMTTSALNRIVDENKINLHFLFGGIDRIMTPREAKVIQKQIPRARVEILSTNHAGLIRNVSDYLNIKTR